MVYSAIDVVNVRVTLKIYLNGKMRTNKLGMPFFALTNDLFDVYCHYKVSKEIRDALTKKNTL